MRGSITIFATMLLMLVSQFLFTVLEAGRNLTLTNIACMNSEAVAESVFAQYCRPLWDEYHLLAYDAGSDAMGNVDIENVKSYMKKLTTDNFKIGDSGTFAGGTIVNGTSMLRLSMDELESMKYVLMTDDGLGHVLRHQLGAGAGGVQGLLIQCADCLVDCLQRDHRSLTASSNRSSKSIKNCGSKSLAATSKTWCPCTNPTSRPSCVTIRCPSSIRCACGA